MTITERFAVWYAAAGCLPDNDEPEYIGSEDECEQYVIQQEHEQVLNMESELAQFAPDAWATLFAEQEDTPEGKAWPSDEDILDLAREEGLLPTHDTYGYSISLMPDSES